MIWQAEFEIYKFPMKAIHLQVALMSPDTRGHDYFDLALGSLKLIIYPRSHQPCLASGT